MYLVKLLEERKQFFLCFLVVWFIVVIVSKSFIGIRNHSKHYPCGPGLLVGVK